VAAIAAAASLCFACHGGPIEGPTAYREALTSGRSGNAADAHTRSTSATASASDSARAPGTFK
jgi:hypothetical protein